ncbi:MAG: DUF5719 family protein [Acidimicrobiales bacterium]
MTAARAGDPGRRRLIAVITLLAVVLIAAGIDRIDRPESDRGATATLSMPAAAPSSALSSTWFCPGGTASGGGEAEGYVAVVNPGQTDAVGTVTVHPTEGEARTVPLTVAASSSVQLRYSELAASPWRAVTVELGAGEVGVEQVISGPLGWSAAPCASQASSEWYFGGGSTARENTLYLTLYNPFPDDAIADLTFATSGGATTPQAFRGVVIRGRSVSVLSVGEHVRRRDDVAGSIVARRGRLVVGRVQVRAASPTGLSYTLGAPSTDTSFVFPEGFVVDGVSERLNLYNPGDREAIVDVEMVLDEGVAEPWEIRIRPRERTLLDFGAEERVPKSVGHGLLVRSLNDIGIVAEQWITANTPSPRKGSSETLGATASATAWTFAAGSADGAWDEWITIQNTSAAEANVDLIVLADGRELAVEGLQDLVVAAGARQTVRLGDHISRSNLALLVRADQPVVAERAVFAVPGPGVSYSIGIPLGLRGR